MDIEKMLVLFPQYFSEYLSAFFLTLRNPTLQFLPSELPKPQDKTLYLVGEQSRKVEKILNPKLISFIVLSIFIGSIIQSFIPNRPTSGELSALILIVTIMWLFISTIIFFIFRLFRGKGSFLDTISISLQVMAVIYTTASLLTLVTTVFFFAANSNTANSFLLYSVIQFILLCIYLPLALKGIHFAYNTKVNFKFVLSVTFSILFVFGFNLVFLLGTGINLLPIPK